MTPNLKEAFEHPLTQLAQASTDEAAQRASATEFSQKAAEIPGVDTL